MRAGIYDALSVEDGAATGRRRSRELDAVRAIAVLMVLSGHAYLLAGTPPPHTSRALGDMLVNTGGAGIWLFFALSGLLIAAPFLRALRDGTPLPSTRGYAARRAARILPAYWVAFAALLVLVPVALQWWQPLLHGALLHNLVPGEGQALFFVAWTLGIEALFYVFVPLAAGLVRRATGARPLGSGVVAGGVLALWAASVAWAVWAAASYPNVGPYAAVENADVFRLSLPALLSAFCPGMLVVLARDAGWPGPLGLLAAQPLAALGLAALLAAGGMLANTSAKTVVIDLSRQPWSLAAGLVLVAALAGWGALAGLARVLAPLGLVSYGLFLWHWVVVSVLIDLGVDAPGWPLRIAFVLALSLPAALASWLLIERPLLRRTARWWQRRRPVPAAAPAQA